MPDKYDKPCFDDSACKCAVGQCDEELVEAGDEGDCVFLSEGGTWDICTSGKLSPRYAEYAAQPAGRKVIVDVEGLKEALCHAMIGRVNQAINEYTITAPDLVRREDMGEASRNCDYSPCESYVFDNVPAWDGKE